MMIEKKALHATVELQVAEIRTLEAKKKSLHKLLEEQGARSGTERKRRRTSDIYIGLSF